MCQLQEWSIVFIETCAFFFVLFLFCFVFGYLRLEIQRLCFITANSIADLVAKYIKENHQETENIHMYKYKGVYFPDAAVKEDTLSHMSTWGARSDDVFVVSYPKAGMYFFFTYHQFVYLVLRVTKSSI